MLHIIPLLFLIAAPPNPDPSLAPFYQELRQPKTGMACCSMADCRTVIYRTGSAGYEVFIDKKTFQDGPDKWIVVPSDVVLPPQTNPTGEGVVCWTIGRGVLCFLRASDT